MNKIKANLLLLVASFIYGSYYIVLEITSDLGFGSAGIIFFKGLVFLVVAAVFLGKGIVNITKKDFILGSIIGSLNFLGFFFQTISSKYTTPSNNAFITSLNTIFVPFFAWIIYKKKPSVKVYISLPVALIGMALLTGIFDKAFSLRTGDLFSFFGAVFFAVVIVLLGNMARKLDIKKILFMMAVWQMLGGLAMFGIQERFALPDFEWVDFILIFFFLGVVLSYGATAVQAYGQRFTSETVAAMILALESVFAFVLAIILGFDDFNWFLFSGGILIVGAVVFLVFDLSVFKRKKPEQKAPDHTSCP